MRKNYIKEFFKSGYLLHTALFTAVTLTLILASYELGLFGALYNSASVLTFAGIVIALFAVVGLAYFYISTKINKITLADAFYFTFALVGILYIIYTAAVLKSFNIRRILFPVILLVIGVAFIVLRVLSVVKMSEEKDAPSNKVKSYYSAIVENYSLFAIIIAAGVCVCTAYIIFNIEFGQLLKDTTVLIMIGVCILPTLIYAAKSAVSKTITILDALLLSGIISFPVLLIQIFMVAYSELRLTIWAFAFLIYMILAIVRLVSFDKDAVKKPACSIKCENCGILKYFNCINKKHDPLITLAISGIIAGVALILLRGRAIQHYLLNSAGELTITLKALPILVTLAASLLSLAFFAIVALISVKAKHVTLGDYFLLQCTTFNVFGFLTLIAHPSPYMLWMLVAFTVYCIVLTVIRIKTVNEN